MPVFFPWFEEPGYQMPVAADFTATDEEKALAAAYGLTDEQLEQLGEVSLLSMKPVIYAANIGEKPLPLPKPSGAASTW